MSTEQIDEQSGVSTTGHEWDGIKELNNPLPRWWVWTFYSTIVWALAYTIAYPAWPMLNSATSGLLGYSSRGAVKQELADADAARVQYVDGHPSPRTSRRSWRTTSFANSRLPPAAPPSRSTACNATVRARRGRPGFPNLNDDDWLWGGSADQIYQTISHGVRFTADADTRSSEMPGFGEMLEPEQDRSRSAPLSQASAVAAANAALVEPGAQVFAENCAACHGDAGKGNREFGAPDLTDALWLYGSGEAAIAAQVRAPKHGVMPAWVARLGDTRVKELTVYVHTLGGGE